MLKYILLYIFSLSVVDQFIQNQKLLSDNIFFPCFCGVSVHESPLKSIKVEPQWASSEQHMIAFFFTGVKLDYHRVKARFESRPKVLSFSGMLRCDWIV